VRHSPQYSFIIFGNSRFEGLYHREHALASELAGKGYDVTFIEEMPSTASKVRDWAKSRMSSDQRPPSTRDPRIAENLKILTPPMVPTMFRSSYTPALDRMIFRRWFRKCFRDYDWSQTIVIVTLPYWWLGFVDRQLAPARTLIYDCHDVLDVPSRNMKTLRRMKSAEDQLVAEADIVTYSAQEMLESLSRKPGSRNRFFLANAVDSDFIKAASRAHTSAGRKKIGYVGSLDERWIDRGLLYDAAVTFGDCDVQIIGSTDRALSEMLRSCSNVSLAGSMDHADLPSRLATCDVLLIPFKRNNITDVVNPLKLYEYCASGKPIVAMSTRELGHYSRYLFLAESHAQFLRLIQRALKESNLSKRASRIRFARNNTWSHRVDTLLKIIQKGS
jgi:hypothetical protein